MRRSLPLLIGVIVTLLAGCADKRELCAQFNATGGLGGISTKDLKQTYKDLGIKQPYAKGESSYRINHYTVRDYCDFYK